MSCMTFSVSFVYTGLLVRAFPNLHRLNLTYYWKSSTLLAFCFLFVCITDPTQIELLELFQWSVCKNERLKGGGGDWSHELLGERQIRAGPRTHLYTMTALGARSGLGIQPCFKAPCALQIKHRQNIVINIKECGCFLPNSPKLAMGPPNSS